MVKTQLQPSHIMEAKSSTWLVPCPLIQEDIEYKNIPAILLVKSFVKEILNEDWKIIEETNIYVDDLPNTININDGQYTLTIVDDKKTISLEVGTYTPGNYNNPPEFDTFEIGTYKYIKSALTAMAQNHLEKIIDDWGLSLNHASLQKYSVQNLEV